MSLKTAVFLCFLGGLALLAAGIAFSLPRFATAVTLQEVERTVATRSASLAQDLGRTLYNDWEELGTLAAAVAELEPAAARAYLDGVASSARVAWIGYAGVDGIVRVASDGVLEGRDVSARPWFAAGLGGGFAGDIHDALLLQAELAPDAAEPLRLIDLALPVRNAAGRTTGVLGMHVDATWLLAYLVESANVRNMDVFLVAADGSVSAASIPLDAAARSTDALRAAATGAGIVLTETWPDGRDYISAVIPQVAYGTLPSFGWRVVGRVPVEASTISEGDLIRQIGAMGLAAASLFALAALTFAGVFLRPIGHLIDVAERISRGETIYPPQSRSTREAARLANALARIQSLLPHDTGPGPGPDTRGTRDD